MVDQENVKDILVRLSNTNSSSSNDSSIIQHVLRKLGFTSAVVTSGIVYLEGHGTLKTPPESIHVYAKTLLVLGDKERGSSD